MASREQRTPPVRLTIPVNRILNDDNASVQLSRHHVHHDHAVSLMVNIVGEPRTVWLDRHDLEQLEAAVRTARGWLGERR